MPLSRPPDSETFTIFSLAFVMAALGALLKILMDGVKRSPRQILMKMFIMGLWGAVYGWAITSKFTISPEALSASAVIVGYAGYEVTIAAAVQVLNPQLAQLMGLDRRSKPPQTRQDDAQTPGD